MYRAILLILSIFFGWHSAFSANNPFPFTDVQTTDSYYDGVKNLYNYGIISDDGSHLFRPTDPITRDAFIGLATSVSCQKCLTPNIEDVLHYTYSPFIDLTPSNPYYYCIASATEKNIVQGYSLGSGGKYTCENGTAYTSTPFCGENKTTRIEAAAMLLRQSQLWDDAKNSGYSKKIEITDISGYWQGYAEKGIQAGILSIDTTGKIYPNSTITRGEFALMAGKMLEFNQCTPTYIQSNSLIGAIGVTDISGAQVTQSRFTKRDGSILIPITESGSWIYEWRGIEKYTGNIITKTGNSLPINGIEDGTWIMELSIKDPTSGKILSQPSSTIQIDTQSKPNSEASLIISTTDTILKEDIPLAFQANTIGLSGDIVYSWNFGDGTIISSDTVGKHTYTQPGLYTIEVTATDASGKKIIGKKLVNIVDTRISSQKPNTSTPISVIIKASSLISNPGKQIDFLSSISGGSYGKATYTWNFGDGTSSNIGGTSSHTYTLPGIYTVILSVKDSEGNMSQSTLILSIDGKTDTDGDGMDDTTDLCIDVYGSLDSSGCPQIQIGDYGKTLSHILGNEASTYQSDRDGDGIMDDADLCKTLAGDVFYDGCPSVSLLSGIGKNQCLKSQLDTHGLIIAVPVCTTCPCSNSASFQSLVRTCDILFPTILSPEKTDVFSRGGFFQVQ